ncbi:GTP 3',8-cyclase MoaA [Candidatus Omnitrophota bacterium]
MNCSTKLDYLRLSVTDRCNLRCIYCIPEDGFVHKPHGEILTFEEIIRITKIFVSLGIRKIRLTGGEPLTRKGIIDLVKSLSQTEGLEDLCMTTNATLLSSYAKELKTAGVKSINISIDTLNREKFKKITGNDSLYSVLEGIEKSKELGFYPLKLNVVIMKGVNDDEIVDFVNFAKEKGLILKFIEFMKVTPLWKERLFVPIEEIKDICHKEFGLQRTEYKSSGPADYYQLDGMFIGFIATLEQNCRMCSRLRLTSTGELKLCLYHPNGLSLKKPLRGGLNDMRLKEIIKGSIASKYTIDYRQWETPRSYICSVGG